jgi:hypothetical protein
MLDEPRESLLEHLGSVRAPEPVTFAFEDVELNPQCGIATQRGCENAENELTLA